MLEFLVILKVQLSAALIILRNFFMKSILQFYKIKKKKNFSLGPNLENINDFFFFFFFFFFFLNLLREYKNIWGSVRSNKFSIKLKQFHQSIESVCNDFLNKNARSVCFG